MTGWVLVVWGASVDVDAMMILLSAMGSTVTLIILSVSRVVSPGRLASGSSITIVCASATSSGR